jgi:hypothetical protein
MDQEKADDRAVLKDADLVGADMDIDNALEVIIADLQAWVEDLRESCDRWRNLALDAERAAAKGQT